MIPLPSRPRFSLKPRLRPLAVWCSVALLGVSHVPLRAQSPVFSEDFESGSLNPAVWDTRTAGDVAITVQQTQVAHGKSALQVHYPKGGSRSYVFISPPAPAGHDVLLNAGAPGYPLSNFLELGASGGKNVMMSYQQNAADAPRGETIARGIAYPVGRWFCLEWEFTDHPDHIVAWIDGAPAGELAGFTFKPRAARGARPSGVADAAIPNARPDPAANPAPAAAIPGTDLVKGFSDFAFGFRAWGAGAKEDFDIYYDDIAIDTKRIGPLP